MSKRKEAEKFLYEYLGKLLNDKEDKNIQLYKNLFSKMSDAQFDEFMHQLKDNKRTLSIIVPTGKTSKITVKNNLKLGEELGYPFFQHLRYEATREVPAYTSPLKYLVIKLPIRRLSQTLTKKASIPDNNNKVSALTGQVTNESRACELTFPEINILSAYGAKNILHELLTARGGDIGKNNALVRSLQQTGDVSLSTVEQYSTGTISNMVLYNFLLGMLIRSTIYRKPQ